MESFIILAILLGFPVIIGALCRIGIEQADAQDRANGIYRNYDDDDWGF